MKEKVVLILNLRPTRIGLGHLVSRLAVLASANPFNLRFLFHRPLSLGILRLAAWLFRLD